MNWASKGNTKVVQQHGRDWSKDCLLIFEVYGNANKAYLQTILKQKKPCTSCEAFYRVTRPGFEPRQTEPESVVLPLYYRAKSKRTKR